MKAEQLREREMQKIALDEEQILLRGSSLRNTEWVYGVAVYTGHETKVMMNSSQSKPKRSKLEITTNKYLIYAMAIQFTICLVASIYSSLWLYIKGDSEKAPPYLMLDGMTALQTVVQVFIQLGRWILALMNFVSISLLVSLEMVKFMQGIFIEYDWRMYDEDKDMSAAA